MTWLKEYPREYYQKYEKVQVQNDYGWYQVYRLPGNVYAICEPQHFQEVNFFLIIEMCIRDSTRDAQGRTLPAGTGRLRFKNLHTGRNDAERSDVPDLRSNQVGKAL